MKVSTKSMNGSPWTTMTSSSSGCLMFISEANETWSDTPSPPQISSCDSTKMALWSQVKSTYRISEAWLEQLLVSALQILSEQESPPAWPREAYCRCPPPPPTSGLPYGFTSGVKNFFFAVPLDLAPDRYPLPPTMPNTIPDSTILHYT